MLRNDYKLILLLSFFGSLVILFFLDIPIAGMAIDYGLVLSNKIEYTDKTNVWNQAIYNSWTLINQIIAFLFKLKINIFIITKILTFLNIFFLLLGVMFIGYAFTSSVFLTFLISIIHLTFIFHIGSADYPILYFSDHIWGELSNSLLIFIIGILFAGFYRHVGFFSMVLISIHPVIGFWNMGIIISFFFLNKFFKFKDLNIEYLNFLKGLMFGSTILISSLLIFFYMREDNIVNISSFYNPELFKSYIDYWDGHRGGNVMWVKFHIKLIFIALILLIFLKKNYKELKGNLMQGTTIIFLGMIISTVIFYIVKLFGDNFLLLWIPIPNRFTVLYSILIFPLSAFIFIYFFSHINNSYLNLKKSNSFFIILIILLCTFYSLFSLNSAKVSNLKKLFVNNYVLLTNSKSQIIDYNLWSDVKKLKIKGSFVGNRYGLQLLSRNAYKPMFFDTSIDFLPYNIKLLNFMAEMIGEMYLVNFFDPPIITRRQGTIHEMVIKKSFEEHSYSDWVNLSQKYKLGGIVVPNDWVINFEGHLLQGKYYKVYIF